MTAICADVKELGNNLVEQSKGARDDIVKRASEKVEMVRDDNSSCVYETAVVSGLCILKWFGEV